MFDAGKLLGQVLRDAASGAIGAGRRPNRRRPSLLGLGTRGVEAKIGLGLLGLAFAAYEHFRQSTPGTGPAAPPPAPNNVSSATPPPPPAATDHEHALHLVRAMICAANADGLIDADERAGILGRAKDGGLGDAEMTALETEMRSPLTLAQLVARTPSELREQVYAAALITITPDTDQENRFLDQLTMQLGMDAAACASVRQQLGL